MPANNPVPSTSVKLSLPEFHGAPHDDPEEFWAKLERLHEACKWTVKQLVTVYLPESLTGSAGKWYRTSVTDAQKNSRHDTAAGQKAFLGPLGHYGNPPQRGWTAAL